MKSNWIDIIKMYKRDGRDGVALYLKNQIITLDFTKTILFTKDTLTFLGKDSKITIITDGDIEEVAIYANIEKII